MSWKKTPKPGMLQMVVHSKQELAAAVLCVDHNVPTCITFRGPRNKIILRWIFRYEKFDRWTMRGICSWGKNISEVKDRRLEQIASRIKRTQKAAFQ